jgi:hypothetical protein
MTNPLINAINRAEEGFWDEAHRIVQQFNDPVANWLHANLHREEGDLDNAKYWYHQAIREYTDMDITEERKQILNFLEGRT